MAKLAKPLKTWVRKRTNAGRRVMYERSPRWLARSIGPAANYLDMLLVDHGVFRLAYLNRHKLGENAWRSAQPAPSDLKRFKKAGVKTVVNLRGQRLSGSYWLEEAACQRLGLKLVNFIVRSRAAPSLDELRGAKALFDWLEYPVLMHCKSGSDRAGLMSVLYMHFVEGQPIEEAVGQLSWRYGHIKQADTGVIDHFFETYLEANRRAPIDFWTWVETAYDPKAVARSFKDNGLATKIVGTVLRRE
jgi:protein tyrosine/serine phosphatase